MLHDLTPIPRMIVKICLQICSTLIFSPTAISSILMFTTNSATTNHAITITLNTNKSTYLDQWTWATKFCGRFCENGSLVILDPNMCPQPVCFPCNCDEFCLLRGTCCPTFGQDPPHINFTSAQSSPTYREMYSLIECTRFSVGYKPVVAVMKCPTTWEDDIVRQQCENPGDTDLTLVTPVTDTTTNLAYRNVFCAQCHGFDPWSTSNETSVQDHRNESQVLERNFETWNLSVSCTIYQNLFHITNQLELYQAAKELEECTVDFVPTEREVECKHEFQFPARPPSCRKETEGNATLQHYAQLCHDLPPLLALRVIAEKNIFCFLCHDNWTIFKSECEDEPGGMISDNLPPLFFLFSTSERGHARTLEMPTEKVVTCKENEWENDEGYCVPASCSPGKVFHTQESCTSILGNMRGLIYRVELSYIPTYPIPLEQRDVITDVIKYSFLRFTVYLDLSQRIVSERNNSESSRMIKMIKVNGALIAPHEELSTEFESKTILDLTSGKHAPIPVGRGDLLFLRTACIGEEACKIFYGNESEKNSGDTIAIKKLTPIAREVKHIELRPDLICPTITLNLTSIPVYRDGQIIFRVKLRNKTVEISDISKVSLVDGQLLVCLDFLKQLSKELKDSAGDFGPLSIDNEENLVVVINYYSDVIGISMSCTCLILSALTYCIFPTLRSLPGLNNMSLCMSLLTAQLSLLISSTIGANGLLNKTHCFIHAIVLHYSWTASFVWMNICCLHMFRVFTGRNFGHPKKTFLVYSLLAFGIPTLVVALTISTTFFVTSGDSTGYDDSVCFLDTKVSKLVVILGILTPLCITVIQNGVLFGLTVKEIVKVARLQEEPRDHHGVLTYVKLSTVTGAFCFLVAAATQFESPILSLLSSPLATLQGVFIFMSFTANTRVAKLYWERFVGDSSQLESSRATSLDNEFSTQEDRVTSLTISGSS